MCPAVDQLKKKEKTSSSLLGSDGSGHSVVPATLNRQECKQTRAAAADQEQNEDDVQQL